MPNPFYSNITPHLKFIKTIGENVNAEATVKLIIQTINTYSQGPYVKKVVEILSQGNPSSLEFLKRLFDIACINVEYLRDPEGHEIVFTPQLLMQVGKGDCKKFNTFILSVMKAKGIEGVPKVVSYEGDTWDHIYVIAPTSGGNYITLDPVNHKIFNKEVDYKKAQLFYLNGKKSEIMDGNKLSLMGSLGNRAGTNQTFVGGLNNAADEILGDIDESFSGQRKRQSCHHSPTLAGLQADYLAGINDENDIAGVDDDDDYNIHGIGKGGKVLKKPGVKIQKTIKKIAPKVDHAVKHKVEKVKARQQARKTPEAKAKRKEKRKKIFKVVKKVGFAPVRAAFLGLILLGGALRKTKLKMNLAGRMAQQWQMDGGASLTKTWESFGGKREALRSALVKSTKVSLSGKEIHMNTDGSFSIAGIGVVTVATAATAVAVSAPLLIAVTKLLNQSGVTNDGEAENVEAVTDVAEEAVMNDSGGDVKKFAKAAASEALVQKAAEIDDGGNPETQQEIIQEATQEEQEQPNQDDENFKKGASQGRGRAPVTNSGEKASTEKYLPVPVTQPTAKSIVGNYKAPVTWIKAMFLLICFSSIYHINPTVSSVLGTVIFIVLVLTVINSLIQKTKRYEVQH